MRFSFILAAIAVFVSVHSGFSQIAIPDANPVTQNFDGIGAAATASLPSNWKMTAAGVSAPTWAAGSNLTATNQQASSGSPTAGARYNWGNGSTPSDRAIGFMTSGGYGSPNSIMAYFRNTSGQELTGLSLAFDYERYRINTAAADVTFFFSTDGSTWTSYASGDSGAFATGGNSYTFTGGTTISRTVSISGLSIAHNGEFYLRWHFDTTGSNSQGLGLDNFSLTPTLTPSGPVTIANGNWNNTATWQGGVIPTATDASVTVNHAVILNVPVTRNAGTTTTISAGASLDMTNPYVSNGTTVFDGAAFVKNGVTIGGGSTFQINGNFYLNLGGNFTSGSPTYGPASTLHYSNGMVYGRGYEWIAMGVGTLGSTPGYPNHVRISGNTTLDYNNGAGIADDKAVAGNLTIDAGSSFYMDYGPNPNNGPLTVGGNVTNNGNLTLGDGVGDDLIVFGDFSSNGAFNGNNRAVIFSALSGTQYISSSSTLTIPYLNFGASGSRTVRLNTDVVVSAPASGQAITFGNAADILNINGRTVTIGTAGISSGVTGPGLFSGTGTSVLRLLGNGSAGTLNFTGATVLNELFVDRTSGAIACVLGTDLRISNALTLTNGLVDLSNRTLTLDGTVTPTVSSSASSYVIADFSSGGALRRGISGAGTYSYPIGDGSASANGSQYSPATVNFQGTGTYTSAFFSVRVEDQVHPDFGGTSVVSRYWSVNSTGTFPAGNYQFRGDYQPIDVSGGPETSMFSDRWTGSAWENSGSAGQVGFFTYTATNYTATNQFAKGVRTPEINLQVSSVNQPNGTTYDFGTLLVPASNAVTFTIQNLGQQTLNLSGATFSGSPDYSYTTAYAPSVSGGGTTTFVVTFSPTGAETFTGSISIPNNDPTGSENPYVINFTGVGQVPAPEINLRAHGGGLGYIVNGATSTDGLNNTAYGDVTIGTPVSKSFRIMNQGNAVLNLTGTPRVAVAGVNPSDFVVTVQPSAATVAASAYLTFTVRFTPTAAGYRSAIVSIDNDDSDENPYTFLVDGTGICPSLSNTIAPLSGPVGTEVTVTAGSGILTGATASFNAVPATVIPVSATQMVVVVPGGAVSGQLTVTNAQGCVITNYFQVIDNTIAGCQGTAEPARTELFISEVTDHGSGSHTYIEIFNATGASVNLSNYSVRAYHNGNGTPTATANLSGTLANNTAYVLAIGNSDANINQGSISPAAGAFTSISGINDNDNIRLFRNATHIDQWGDQADVSFTVASRDYTYRRKNAGITAPSTTWNPNDWVAFSPVDYSNIRSYDFSRGTPPVVTVHPAYNPGCKGTTFTVAANEGFSGGNALTYQWFSLAPGASTWVSLTNAGVYSGVTTDTLVISDVTSLIGYQFYCQIRENTGTCFSASNAEKIDTTSVVTWNGSVWTPSAPDDTKAVVLNASYDTATWGSFSACSLTVASGILDVSGGTYVEVVNDLSVSVGATMNVLDDGSLVMIEDSGLVTNNGTMRMHRTPTPFMKFDYTYWSSPMVSASLSTTFTGWRTDYAFTFDTGNFADLTGSGGTGPADGYDDDANAWVNASGPMVRGKGYAVMGPTNAATYPINPMVTFTGTYNNGVITHPLALSANNADPFDDFNLVGNPYPGALLADEFVSANPDISGTLYFWTHRTPIAPAGNGTYQFITSDYAMFTPGSGGVASANGGATPTNFVASGQGFFVEADLATQVEFNNSMREAGSDNSNFYRMYQTEGRDRIWLNMTHDSGLFSQQLFAFVNGATAGFDRGYDGRVSKSQNAVSFYSFVDEVNYRIQGRPQFDSSDVIPLGYSTQYASEYLISIDHAEGIFLQPEQSVYLEDKQLQVFHDLKTGAYPFETSAGEFNDRFQLRFALPLGGDAPEAPSSLVVSSRPGWFQVVSGEEVQAIEVVDLLGRKLYSAWDLATNRYEAFLSGKTDMVVLIRVSFSSGRSEVRKIRI